MQLVKSLIFLWLKTLACNSQWGSLQATHYHKLNLSYQAHRKRQESSGAKRGLVPLWKWLLIPFYSARRLIQLWEYSGSWARQALQKLQTQGRAEIYCLLPVKPPQDLSRHAEGKARRWQRGQIRLWQEEWQRFEWGRMGFISDLKTGIKTHLRNTPIPGKVLTRSFLSYQLHSLYNATVARSWGKPRREGSCWCESASYSLRMTSCISMAIPWTLG